nr:MAG TPA: hypothetical protein [Caudoviricetes sp.]
MDAGRYGKAFRQRKRGGKVSGTGLAAKDGTDYGLALPGAV